MAEEKKILIPGRLKNIAVSNYLAGASDIIDDSLGKSQQEINAEVTSTEEDLDTRLNVVEQLAEISVAGGEIGIATANDLKNRTTAGDAKIPTVAAVMDSADATPTAGSTNWVTSGGVYEQGVYRERIVTSKLVEENCSLGIGKKWQKGGHVALPVIAGSTVEFEITEFNGKTSGNYYSHYIFVTEDYNPPYAVNDAIPVTGNDSRLTVNLGLKQTIEVPSNAAYLILVTRAYNGEDVVFDCSVVREVKDWPTQTAGLPHIQKSVNALNMEIYGEINPIATWDYWKNSGSARIWAGCDAQTVEGGLIVFSVNDYTTYKIALNIVSDNNSWKTSGQIYASGWRRSDIYHNVSDLESGYFVQVTIARVDGGDITTEEAQSIVSKLDYSYYSNGVSIIQRLDALEAGTETAIPIQPLLGTSPKYVGDIVELPEHPYSYELIGSFRDAGVTDGVQGGCVFGDYLFQFHADNEKVVIFNLATTQVVQVITLEKNTNNHANSASFCGQYYDSNDPFPCVCVSCQKEKKVYVYRITGTEGSYVMTLVQTLTHSLPYYLMNVHFDAPNNRGIIVGYTANSAVSGANNQMYICCFDMPDVTAGDIVLEHFYGEFTCPFLYAAQSAFGSYGKLYHAFGSTDSIGGILIIDYINKTVKTFIDLSFVGNIEPEGLGYWNNGLIFTTQGKSVYKLTF